MAYKLPDLRDEAENKNCVQCGHELKSVAIAEQENITSYLVEGDSVLAYYPHPDGLNIVGFDKPQWVYVVCKNCEYQNSFEKLELR